LSDRNLAEVVAYYSGKDYSLVLNDIYRVQSTDIPTSEAIANLKEDYLCVVMNSGLRKDKLYY